MRFPDLARNHGLNLNKMNREVRLDVRPAAFPGDSRFEFCFQEICFQRHS